MVNNVNATTKIINWKAKEQYAKKLSISELSFAINDCIQCVKNGIDQGYYSDEASIYRKELNKRMKKPHEFQM